MNMPMQLCRQRSAVTSDVFVKTSCLKYGRCLSSFSAVRTQKTQYKTFRREIPKNHKYVFDMIFDSLNSILVD